jgi:predicted transposase/invertase (TIGR01784 family)
MQRPSPVADAWAMLPAPAPFERLDPTLDIVFKLLLIRTQALLVDMLEAILGRPIAQVTILNPEILGELASDKRVVLDIRVALSDGSRIDVEMQARTAPALRSRLVYYATRDYSDQLDRGDGYEELTPTVVIVWLVEPIKKLPHRLHTVYELRERHTHEPFGDQLAIHVLQLSALPASGALGYSVDARVERWARFFSAQDDADYDQLASEDPIMATAKEALDQLSRDPAVHRLARERADAIKLHELDLASWRKKDREEGLAAGEAKLLLRQLSRRFGPLAEATRARVQSATVEQIEIWAERILDAPTLDDVLAPAP